MIFVIKVCDSIMGSGKSESCITYMNGHPDQKFIYITPYLPEAKRIKESCPNLHFVEPSNKLPDFKYSKSTHCASLIHEGYNISSTHQLWKQYTSEMLEDVRRNHYTLIIDEAVETFVETEISLDDLEMINRAGYLERDGPEFKLVDESYDTGRFRDIFSMLKHNQLVAVKNGATHKKNKGLYYCWIMAKDLILAFDEVIVLTYMFDCQDLAYYLQLNNIGYKAIGVERTPSGEYRFTDTVGYKPDYAQHIKDRIHICNTASLNKIGNTKTALSESWFKRDKENPEAVKKNLYNFFMNHNRSAPADERLWGTYKYAKPKIKGKGYANRYLVFNQKSSNEYRDKTVLAYCVNLFMNPDKRRYLASMGADVKEDQWALSEMIQWIWRSAIREGGEIWIYVPSKRMRTLLINWMNEVSCTNKGTIKT